MPGAGFQRIAARSRELNRDLMDKPFQYVQNAIVSSLRLFPMRSLYLLRCVKAKGTAKHCMVTSLLDDPPLHETTKPAFEEAVKRTVGTAYAGQYSLFNLRREGRYLTNLDAAGSDTVQTSELLLHARHAHSQCARYRRCLPCCVSSSPWPGIPKFRQRRRRR
jgi:hypothetical protein